MPWGVAAGVVGSVAGSAISSAMAPSTSGGNSGGSYYTPTGLQDTDQAWQGLFQNQIAAYNNNSNNLYGYGQQSLNQGLNANNQYAPGYQAGANQAGQTYQQQGNQAFDNSGFLNQQGYNNYGTAQGLQSQGQNALNGFMGVANQTYHALNTAGDQVWQTAQDPQSALYNRSVQQLQDQTGATNSMYGLGSSAAGAGVANQALSNFNIDWQNQQLQRQLSGLQGLAGAYGQGASSYAQNAGAGQTAYNNAFNQAGSYQQLGSANLQNANSMLGTAAGSYLNAGQVPYQTAQGVAATPGNLANAAQTNLQNTVYGPSQAITGQAIPYMNYGQGAQQVPYQNALNGAGAAGSMVAQGIQGLGNNSQFQQAASNGFNNLFGGSSQQGYFGNTQSPGNYSGTGYGGYGMGSGGDFYSGGGNSYGFTLG
jgi:hypothetical protein